MQVCGGVIYPSVRSCALAMVFPRPPLRSDSAEQEEAAIGRGTSSGGRELCWKRGNGAMEGPDPLSTACTVRTCAVRADFPLPD